MNVTVTERDKKLLGFLAAFLIALAFFMLVFRPLAQKNSQLKAEIKEARLQEIEFDNKASDALNMSAREEETRQQLSNVLARFYPMQQSQNAEKKVTTLMLNHNLEIQSLTVTMPENASTMKWYQYSQNAGAAEEIPASQEEGQEAILSMYGARVVCMAEGDEQDMWELIDDISDNFPAISIVSVEWNTSEVPEEVIEAAEHEGEAIETEDGREIEAGETMQQAEAGTVRTDRLTIGLEIFMCNQ
ncbi:MAG: type II secretion system protein GspM [Bacillota bacterium]|nr:type II secretion system protein GspM [Bacillota bacterium]